MKKISMLLFWTLLITIGVSAQENKVNFTGVWELDVSESELSERSRIESMTMTVTQTKKEIVVKTKSKLADDENPGSGVRIKLKSKGKGNGDVYKFDGSETVVEMDGDADGTVTKKVDVGENGNLILTHTIDITFQGNEIQTVRTDTWELSEDGKTLTVSREIENSRGTRSSKLVFAKQ